MAEANRIYEKLGYPVVSQEEGEELTRALTSLADPDSSDGAVWQMTVPGMSRGATS